MNDDSASALPPPPLPRHFAATREALHLVAARVLGAARYAAVGRLGLIVVPGGFATPEFDGRQLLVVDGILSDGSRRRPLTTLQDAFAFAGVDPDAPTHPVLDLPADPTAPLDVDSDAARFLARWFAFGQGIVEAFAAGSDDADDTSSIQLWPEHFDLAVDKGAPGTRAGYGASPGDTTIDEPYIYVSFHDHHDGPFWNISFGAALTYREIDAGADPLAFFRRGYELLHIPQGQ